jgi:regulatory associated protein of mTOR
MRTIAELPLLGRHSQSVHPAPPAVQPEGQLSQNSHQPTPAAMHTASQPTPSTARAPNNSLPSDMNGHTLTVARTTSTGPPLSRPALSRAKSDIGPRAPEPSDSADEVSSADGNFKIRHGWDDQLNSEEYNNLLTSVSLR